MRFSGNTGEDFETRIPVSRNNLLKIVKLILEANEIEVYGEVSKKYFSFKDKEAFVEFEDRRGWRELRVELVRSRTLDWKTNYALIDDPFDDRGAFADKLKGSFTSWDGWKK